MANPNNLIRPPVLNAADNSSALPSGSNRPVSADLQTYISEQIRSALRECIPELSQALRTYENRSDDSREHVQIDLGRPGTDDDKIPDVVKCIRDFSGQPGQFGSWKKSVDRVLQCYESIINTPKYYCIINAIRNKIIGEADIILESYNTPLIWSEICKCLVNHYADKRDLRTLEYQMGALNQGNKSVVEFYQQVYGHLSLLLEKISCMTSSRESICLFTSSYREKALDTFIRGLKGNLPTLLAISAPEDLPQALQLCLKLENQNSRSEQLNVPKTKPNNNDNYKRINHYDNRQKMWQNAPIQNQALFYPQNVPLRHSLYPNNNGYSSRPSFYRNNNNQGQYVYTPPPRPSAPKPPPRPEPMDVDTSMRSRNINYMNHPHANDRFVGRRPPPPMNDPNKRQRNFHIEAGENARYEDEIQNSDENFDQTLDDYIDPCKIDETTNDINEEQYHDHADIYFLDNDSHPPCPISNVSSAPDS